MAKNILVVGSGVTGLTTALTLQNAGHNVTVWSKEADGDFPHTSHNAYAMWWPINYLGDTPERWADETRLELEKLASIAGSGVSMRKIMSVQVTKETPWFSTKAGFRHANPGEVGSDYVDAHVFDKAPIVDPTVYLPWLRAKAVKAGVVFFQKEIKALTDCPPAFDIVVNCSGLGARQLCNDATLRPSRLQVVTIKPNGFQDVVFDDVGANKMACIVPHDKYIKLGAVYDEDQESLDGDDTVTDGILARCAAMVPGFKADKADVISITRGLRPMRPSIRVESETLANGVFFVHNYGHDGTGYIVSYGAAKEVLSIVNAKA